jgi:hypothetical protein
MTQEWQNKILEQLKSEAVIYPDSLLEQNYSFAKSLSWKNQTDKLINFVDYDNKVVC